MSEWITDRRPTLTKLEYFALIISAQCDGQRDLWADEAINKAQELIAALDKVQSQKGSYE